MTLSFSSRETSQNPISYGYGKFGDRHIGSVFPSIPQKDRTSITIDATVDLLIEDLERMLQQLQSFQPICHSPVQQQLAGNALIALKNRQNEGITELADKLAGDVAAVLD